MLELFNYGFLIRSLISLIMFSLMSSLNGTYLFHKKELKVLPSLIIALFSGLIFSILINSNYIIYSSTIALILLFVLLYLRKNKKDSNIYLITFFTFSVISVFLISLIGFYKSDISFYLIGNIFTISNNEAIFLTISSLFTMLLYFLFFDYLKPITFNEKIAHSEGLYVTLYNYIFLLLVSINIILSFRIVGLFLILPYLILPSMISHQLTTKLRNNFFFTSLISLSLSMIAFFLGITYNLNIASLIIMLMLIIFVFVKIFK
ncbi:MAG: metal ABC transporter permease [Candidatus Woesearchaeota archaeon]